MFTIFLETTSLLIFKRYPFFIHHYHRFQRYELTITEKSPAISILPFPVFLYFFPIFPSQFYILSKFVYPFGSRSSSWSFSLYFVCSIFLGILSSPIHITCPNHQSALFIECYFWFQPVLVLTLVFPIMSSFVLFKFTA